MSVENPDVFDDPKSIYYARDSHLDDGSALVAVLVWNSFLLQRSLASSIEQKFR